MRALHVREGQDIEGGRQGRGLGYDEPVEVILIDDAQEGRRCICWRPNHDGQDASGQVLYLHCTGNIAYVSSGWGAAGFAVVAVFIEDPAPAVAKAQLAEGGEVKESAG